MANSYYLFIFSRFVCCCWFFLFFFFEFLVVIVVLLFFSRNGRDVHVREGALLRCVRQPADRARAKNAQFK